MKRAERKPDHTRSKCSGEEEIISKFMFFTPFNVKLKVGIDLPDTLNASISHDLVTEKFYDEKKCVSIMLLNNAIMFTKELRIITCSAFTVLVRKQSHCPHVKLPLTVAAGLESARPGSVLLCERVLGAESM